MRQSLLFTPLLFGIAATSACRDEVGDDVVSELVSQYDKSGVGPAEEVWAYRYHGEMVYYFPPRCCDIPSVLFDKDGAVLCSPDGGLTGAGDGRCPDFFDDRNDGELVWTAERQDEGR